MWLRHAHDHPPAASSFPTGHAESRFEDLRGKWKLVLERERCLERVSRLRMNPQINSSLMERGPAPCLPPPCRLISISFLLFQLPFPLDHRGWLSLIARTSGAESNGRLLPPGPQRVARSCHGHGTELPWEWVGPRATFPCLPLPSPVLAASNPHHQ